MGSLKPSRTSLGALLLCLNVRRRMVMRDMPFTAALGNEHGETRRPRYRLAFLHTGKLVKARDHNGVVAYHNGVTLLDSVLVATTLDHREIFTDCLCPYGDDRTYGSQKNRVRGIEFYDGLGVIGVVCRRKTIDHGVRLFRRAGYYDSGQHQHQRHEQETDGSSRFRQACRRDSIHDSSPLLQELFHRWMCLVPRRQLCSHGVTSWKELLAGSAKVAIITFGSSAGW